jgi:hypothetical protein
MFEQCEGWHHARRSVKRLQGTAPLLTATADPNLSFGNFWLQNASQLLRMNSASFRRSFSSMLPYAGMAIGYCSPRYERRGLD